MNEKDTQRLNAENNIFMMNIQNNNSPRAETGCSSDFKVLK